MTAGRSFTDTDLNAYIDGELSGTERAAVEAWLNADADAALRLKALRALDQRLKGTFEFVLDEPASRTMQASVLARGTARRWPGWSWAAVTLTAAVLTGAAGYAGRGWLDARVPRPALVETAVVAHRLFTQEVRHPVGVPAADEAHLVKWLTKRLGTPVKVPVLQEQGFKLLGGRLLPEPGGPSAQVMYESAQGGRLTLYARRVAGGAQDSAFAFAQQTDLATVTWIDRPLAFALVAKLPRDDLQRAATAVYEQLQK